MAKLNELRIQDFEQTKALIEQMIDNVERDCHPKPIFMGKGRMLKLLRDAALICEEEIAVEMTKSITNP